MRNDAEVVAAGPHPFVAVQVTLADPVAPHACVRPWKSLLTFVRPGCKQASDAPTVLRNALSAA